MQDDYPLDVLAWVGVALVVQQLVACCDVGVAWAGHGEHPVDHDDHDDEDVAWAEDGASPVEDDGSLDDRWLNVGVACV